MKKDIRWHQRFQNFQDALAELTVDMDILKKRQLTRTEERGMIQAFEFTYEMAWNTIKDFFEVEGETDIMGSRSAIRVAFGRGLIENGQIWMDMIDDRIQTVHTYNKQTADKIAARIIKYYYPEFVLLQKKLSQIKAEQK